MKLIILAILSILGVVAVSPVQSASQSLTIDLKWVDTSNSIENAEDGFYIYQSICVGAPCVPNRRLETILPPNTTSFTDTINNDPGGRTICYAISSFNKIGESGKSNTACIITPAIIVVKVPPNSPTGVIATIIATTVTP